MKRHWIIIPFLDCWGMTRQAIDDALGQEGLEGEPHVLAVSNGSSRETRGALEHYALERPRLLAWHHSPTLPSLAATWNTALDFVWRGGHQEALCINNDVRLHLQTYTWLHRALEHQQALFVSGVGVTEEQFAALPTDRDWIDLVETNGTVAKGGPDFSCYLISKVCHEKYRFDENFIPCYTEDVDTHRRMMLGGDGQKIFSVNIPYLHIDHGSGTLKSFDLERRAAFERRISEGSRRYYQEKWGGPVNQETFLVPFGEGFDIHDHVTTPELFEKERQKWQGQKT